MPPHFILTRPLEENLVAPVSKDTQAQRRHLTDSIVQLQWNRAWPDAKAHEDNSWGRPRVRVAPAPPRAVPCPHRPSSALCHPPPAGHRAQLLSETLSLSPQP